MPVKREYKKTVWNKPVKKVKEKFPKKKTVWHNFSRYIRTRDCIATTNTLTECICVTCKKRVNYKQLQAGHAIQGRKNAVLFDEELVNGQCEICNGYGGGNYDKYSIWFIDRYGVERWREKVQANRAGVQLKGFMLKELNEMYKQRYKKLVEDFNNAIKQ